MRVRFIFKSFLRGIVFLMVMFYSVWVIAEVPNSCRKFFNVDWQATDTLATLLDVTKTKIPSLQNVADICENPVVKGWRTHPGVERWDLKLVDDLRSEANSIIDICENSFDTKEEVLPKKNIGYSGVLFLGASFNRVVSRVKFYNELVGKGVIDKNLKIWVLSGERSLNESIGETKESFIKLIPDGEEHLPLPQNEFDMIKFVFHYLMPKNLNIEYVYGEKDPSHTRATTASTVRAWLKEIPGSPKKIYYFAMSNQPYVNYQESVINLVLRKIGREDVEVHAIGEAAMSRTNLDNYAAILLDTISKITWNCNEMFKLSEDIKQVGYRSKVCGDKIL